MCQGISKGSQGIGVQNGETQMQKAEVGGIFSGFNHRTKRGTLLPVWAVTELCLQLSPI